jgi:archaellum component FlaC
MSELDLLVRINKLENQIEELKALVDFICIELNDFRIKIENDR